MSTDQNILVKLNNAGLQLNNKWLVKGVSLKVEKGKIVIYKRSNESIIETIDVRSSQVSGANTNQITITPRAKLAPFTEYYLKIDSLAFDDLSGNSFAGLEDRKQISFYTGATESISDLDSCLTSFPNFF